ncbi:MAG: bifunctional oligoribonuclease/PAP phosphatase NrnA [Firmicutes bacterium]|nr:bifunctional oligoribonuclease/PAP phosphatase NrnA [Bacillota bacterium]
MNSLVEIAGAINRAKKVLVSGHVMPDGDSLGSVLAMGLVLKSLGKQVTMAGPDRVPAVYEFLPGAKDFQVVPPAAGDFDTFITLDCSVPERLGKGFTEIISQEIIAINIDHHAGSTSFGHYRYIDPLAAATGEILFDLFDLMKIELTQDVAVCLYTAISTDTGSFQYESTTSLTHRRVARLIEAGVPVAEINALIHEEKPLAALRLLGAALSTLRLSDCGRAAWMTVTREDMNKIGADDEHADGLVNYARSVMGVEIGILFRELVPGKYKLSFRSKGSVDVNRLASVFGGGGHRRAAGCVLEGVFDDLQKRVISESLKSLR